jgi:hypothetical protein
LSWRDFAELGGNFGTRSNLEEMRLGFVRLEQTHLDAKQLRILESSVQLAPEIFSDRYVFSITKLEHLFLCAETGQPFDNPLGDLSTRARYSRRDSHACDESLKAKKVSFRKVSFGQIFWVFYAKEVLAELNEVAI